MLGLRLNVRYRAESSVFALDLFWSSLLGSAACHNMLLMGWRKKAPVTPYRVRHAPPVEGSVKLAVERVIPGVQSTNLLFGLTIVSSHVG